MKRLILAGIGALAVITTIGSANAADIARRQAMPTKAPSLQLYNWTGAYIGINGGGDFGRSEVSAPLATGGFNTRGGTVGGTIGYNYQMGQAVFGVEGDGDWSNNRGSAVCAVGVICETRNDWLATGRGRVGYAFDRFLPFVTGGLAVGNIKSSATGLGSVSTTKAGWTAGGGLEAAITGPWTAKVEYLYVDLGNASALTGATASLKTSLVRGGLNYRF
jgi:outer membrane immunogenic protein